MLPGPESRQDLKEAPDWTAVRLAGIAMAAFIMAVFVYAIAINLQRF